MGLRRRCPHKLQAGGRAARRCAWLLQPEGVLAGALRAGTQPGEEHGSQEQEGGSCFPAVKTVRLR